MMAAKLQSLLRFLTQDAKVPLAAAMSSVKGLQKEDLVDVAAIAQSNATQLEPIFADEKLAKQVLSAAKRVSKKRPSMEHGEESSPKKARKSLVNKEPVTAAEMEASIALPKSDLDQSGLSKIILFTNRAPLVLAFVVTLLKYTMPNQPLSSHLSLAQAYVSVTSRSRAVYLGIETGNSAEEEGFGQGQPTISIMGKELRVMKRHGYDWREDQIDPPAEDEPALWGIDLEALKRSESTSAAPHSHNGGGSSTALPIYTPQSARTYLLKSFDSPREDESSQPQAKSAEKRSAAAVKQTKEANLGHLLKALDLLYSSWASTIEPKELDRKSWGWYTAVRPAVADGVAGWGGKNNLKLADILNLRKKEPE